MAGPLQETAADFVNSPAWRTHKRRVAAELGVRRDALVSSLAATLPELELAVRPRGGMHVWVRLPADIDDVALAAAALAEGVAVTAGRAWFATDPDGPHLRLTFGETSASLIPEGVRRLARAIEAMR